MEKKKLKVSPFQIVLFSVLVIYVAILIYALAWALIASLKDPYLDHSTALEFPKVFAFNYEAVFNALKIPSESGVGSFYLDSMALYSVLYAFGCAVVGTITPCIVAYLCAKFKYKFSSIVYTTVIVVMAIPIVGNQPSEIKMAMSLGIYDTIWGMWIMKTTFLGMYFLIFHAIFSSMPNGYAEAARIDGAGNVQILFHIALPLVKNTMITVGLLLFINYWNDYSIPMIYLPSYPVLAYGLFVFTDSNAYVPYQMAGATILVVPMLIIFLIFQKRLMGNLTEGGLKG